MTYKMIQHETPHRNSFENTLGRPSGSSQKALRKLSESSQVTLSKFSGDSQQALRRRLFRACRLPCGTPPSSSQEDPQAPAWGWVRQNTRSSQLEGTFRSTSNMAHRTSARIRALICGKTRLGEKTTCNIPYGAGHASLCAGTIRKHVKYGERH